MEYKHNIDGITFKSDKDVQARAKYILYTDDINSELVPYDFRFMCDYFKKIHHEWNQKFGVGIKSIRRISDKITGKYRTFEIERIDGTKTDISYIVNNIKSKNPYSEFKKALRAIAMPQILDFKRIAFFTKSQIVLCPITGDEINFSNCHIDHYNPTFDEIVNDFITEHRILDIQKILAPSRDNQLICEIKDKDIVNSFYTFHLKRANLRAVSVRANLSILKRT